MSKQITLSAEQQAVDQAVKRGDNVLATGAAGTGKSTLLNAMRRRYNDALTVVASTGIAAMNVGGTTLHSFAGLGLGTDSAEVIADRILGAKESRVYRNIVHTDILAIDEISMISAELLDLIDELFRLVRDDMEPFGGMQIVAFGDFLQLPPVSRGSQSKFAFEAKAWNAGRFRTLMLTRVYRQADQQFADALMRLRVGDIHHPAVNLLASRSNIPLPKDGIRPVIIETHNKNVDEQNTAELDLLPGKEFAFKALDRGGLKAMERLNRDCLAPETLRLKIGAQVMLLANVDLESGLANGSLGVVTKLDEKEIAVKFPKAGTVTMERREYSITNNGQVLATRNQYPLRLSYAITSHKAQGLTLDRILVRMGNVFDYGQAYVAVSRVKTLEGLYMQKTTRHAFRAHPRAVEFYRSAEASRVADLAA
jgi:ATP-dependent DNA helicase PIF1